MTKKQEKDKGIMDFEDNLLKQTNDMIQHDAVRMSRKRGIALGILIPLVADDDLADLLQELFELRYEKLMMEAQKSTTPKKAGHNSH